MVEVSESCTVPKQEINFDFIFNQNQNITEILSDDIQHFHIGGNEESLFTFQVTSCYFQK